MYSFHREPSPGRARKPQASEPAEEHCLLGACRVSTLSRVADIVTVALETGMRRSEVKALTWDRVDFSRGVIRLEVTKSGKRREVPMRVRVDAILAGMPEPRTGRVWPEASTRAAFEAAVEVARLDAPFRFHDCRHHFPSWFMMRGGTLLTLQKVLGHASLAMTMRYAHLSRTTCGPRWPGPSARGTRCWNQGSARGYRRG